MQKMINPKVFVKSIASVDFYDRVTGALLAHADCVNNAAMTRGIDEGVIRGGIGNKIVAIIPSEADYRLNIVNAKYDIDLEALVVGTTVSNVGHSMVVDTLTLDATGKGTLLNIPAPRLGDDTGALIGTVLQANGVWLKNDNGVTITQDSTTNAYEIDLGVPMAGQTVKFQYTTLRIGMAEFGTSAIPVGSYAFAVAKYAMYYGSDANKVNSRAGFLTITIPNGQFVLSGDLGGDNNTPWTQGVQFVALPSGTDIYDCDTLEGNMFYMTEEFCDADWTNFAQGLLAMPSDMVLSATTTTGQITVDALVDGESIPIDAADLVFTSAEDTVATVDKTGLVTYVGTGTTEITITPSADFANPNNLTTTVSVEGQ